MDAFQKKSDQQQISELNGMQGSARYDDYPIRIQLGSTRCLSSKFPGVLVEDVIE